MLTFFGNVSKQESNQRIFLVSKGHEQRSPRLVCSGQLSRLLNSFSNHAAAALCPASRVLRVALTERKSVDIQHVCGLQKHTMPTGLREKPAKIETNVQLCSFSSFNKTKFKNPISCKSEIHQKSQHRLSP